MDSASTSSELHSDTGSIADSDLREVDLELSAATVPTQVVEVSIHQSSVEEFPAIVAGQALTMDIVTVPLCAQLITCAHAPPLGVTSNQLLLSSTTAPLLISGPSFLPVTQGPISMLPGTRISFSGVLGMPVALPTPYSAIHSASGPYSAIHVYSITTTTATTTTSTNTNNNKKNVLIFISAADLIFLNLIYFC